MKFLDKLTHMQKGIMYLVIGFLILLDSLNLLGKTIHYVILLSAIGLIIYGILLTDLTSKVFKKK